MSTFQGGNIVSRSEKQPAISQHFQTKLVVVEVKNGESQDDAWHRYLGENPGSVRAQIKIFHFPQPSPK